MQIRAQPSYRQVLLSYTLPMCQYVVVKYHLPHFSYSVKSEETALSEGEMAVLLSTSEKSKEFKKTLEVYNEFKRLREQIGKPVRSTIDPKQIKRDLTGEDFYALLRDIEKRKH